MKRPVKQIAGVRLTPEASAAIASWVLLTGRSANWLTSWCVDNLRSAMIAANHSETAKAELDAMGRVQAELELGRKKVAVAKQTLAAVRGRKSHT